MLPGRAPFLTSEVCCRLVVACQTSQQAIAREVLATLVDYISWIDIHLIANQKWIPLFYKFLTIPALQNEACQCLVEVVYKGIADKQKKLELLQQLRCADLPPPLLVPPSPLICGVAGDVRRLFEVLSQLKMSQYDDQFASATLPWVSRGTRLCS